MFNINARIKCHHIRRSVTRSGDTGDGDIVFILMIPFDIEITDRITS